MQAPIQKQAKALLNLFGPKGEHWAKDAEAYNKKRGGLDKNDDEETVSAKSKEAQSWCFIGAIHKLDFETGLFVDAIVEYSNGDHNTIESFNDDEGWKEVKSLLTRLATNGSVLTGKQLKAKQAFTAADLAYVAARTALEEARDKCEQLNISSCD